MTSRRQPEFIAMAADQVGIFHIQDLQQQAEKEISSGDQGMLSSI